jgi:hypothetical protein
VSLPGWLDTTPCLVLKEEKKALKGIAVLEYINTYAVKEAAGSVGNSGRKSTGHKKVIWEE